MATDIEMLERFKERFRPLGARWEDLKKEIGDLLCDAFASLNKIQFKHLQHWIKTNYKISYASQIVCRRFAANEIPQALLGVVPDNILCKIHNDKMPDPEKIYRIYSPSVNAIVDKRIADFTSLERQLITPHGVMVFGDNIPKSRHFTLQRAYAVFTRMEGQNAIFFSKSLDKEIVVRVSSEMGEAIKNIREVG